MENCSYMKLTNCAEYMSHQSNQIAGVSYQPSAPIDVDKGETNMWAMATGLLTDTSRSFDESSGITQKNAIELCRKIKSNLDDIDEALQHTVAPMASELARDIVSIVTDEVHTPPAGGRTVLFKEVSRDLRRNFEEEANRLGLRELDLHGRLNASATYISSLLHQISKNESQGSASRWLSNIANSLIRPTLTVTLTTILRQLSGFYVERCYQQGGCGFVDKATLAAVIVAFNAVLIGVGMVRDVVMQTGTWTTCLSKLLTLGLGVAVMAIGYMAVTEDGESMMENLLSVQSMEIMLYALTRDGLELVLPSENNCVLDAQGIAGGALAYGGLQFANSMAMDYLAPNSGSGYVRSAASAIKQDASIEAGNAALQWVASHLDSAAPIEERVRSAIASITPHFSHDCLRGMFNGATEMAENIITSVFLRAANVARAKQIQPAGTALTPAEEEGLRIATHFRKPTGSEVLKKLLNVMPIRCIVFLFAYSMVNLVSFRIEKSGYGDLAKSTIIALTTAAATIIGLGIFYNANAHKSRIETPPDAGAERADNGPIESSHL